MKTEKPTIGICGGDPTSQADAKAAYFSVTTAITMATALAEGGYPIVLPASSGYAETFARAYVMKWQRIQKSLGGGGAKTPPPVTAISEFSSLGRHVDARCPVVDGVKMEFYEIGEGIGIMANYLVAISADIVVCFREDKMDCFMTLWVALEEKKRPVVLLKDDKSGWFTAGAVKKAQDPVGTSNLLHWFETASQGLAEIANIEQQLAAEA